MSSACSRQLVVLRLSLGRHLPHGETRHPSNLVQRYANGFTLGVSHELRRCVHLAGSYGFGGIRGGSGKTHWSSGIPDDLLCPDVGC